MKNNRRSPLFATLTALLLLAPFCANILITDVTAQSLSTDKAVRKVSPDLRGQGAGTGADRVSVIVQLAAPAGGPFKALLSRNDVRVKGSFRNLNSLAVELPAGVS